MMGSFLCCLGWYFETRSCISAHTARPWPQPCCGCNRQSYAWANSGACHGLGQQPRLTQSEPLHCQKGQLLQCFDGWRKPTSLLWWLHLQLLCGSPGSFCSWSPPLQEKPLFVTRDTRCSFQRAPKDERRGFSHNTDSLHETRRVKP